MVPWLGFGAFIAMGPSSIPGQGINIPRAEWYSQKKKKKFKQKNKTLTKKKTSYYPLFKTNFNVLVTN